MKIPFELQSHNDLNLFRKGTITAIQIKAMAKNFVGNGAQTCDLAFTMANDDSDNIFLAFSQRPGKVVAWYNHPKSGP